MFGFHQTIMERQMKKKRKKNMTLAEEVDDILARPLAPVVRVGRVFFDLGREGSLAAARRGDIPTMRVGRREYAITAKLKKIVHPPEIA
jgi:hypothetical protein